MYLVASSTSSRVAEFPAFTVCPSYQKSFKPKLLSYDGLSANDMRNFNYPTDKDSAMYLKNVTHNVTDLIKSITGNYRNTKISIPRNQMFVVFKTTSTLAKPGFKALIIENSICYTYNHLFKIKSFVYLER